MRLAKGLDQAIDLAAQLARALLGCMIAAPLAGEAGALLATGAHIFGDEARVSELCTRRPEHSARNGIEIEGFGLWTDAVFVRPRAT